MPPTAKSILLVLETTVLAMNPTKPATDHLLAYHFEIPPYATLLYLSHCSDVATESPFEEVVRFTKL